MADSSPMSQGPPYPTSTVPRGQPQGYPQGPPPAYSQRQPQGYPQAQSTENLPPSYGDGATGQHSRREQLLSDLRISPEDAKESLQIFVEDKCCYGKGPIDRINYNDMKTFNAFHYSLESFHESRSVMWKHEPYCGQPFTSTGTPMDMWEMPVQLPALFQNSKRTLQLPNSPKVGVCEDCRGEGFGTCNECRGNKKAKCGSCHGSGTGSDGYQCGPCRGKGETTCGGCAGSGKATCRNCKGHGKILQFLELTVEWQNDYDHHVFPEGLTLPWRLITKVEGLKLFEQSQNRVTPVNNFEVEEINRVSSNLIRQHKSTYDHILMQRQRIRIVPVAEVSCTQNGKNFPFFVYGQELKVFCPEYPAKCCCIII